MVAVIPWVRNLSGNADPAGRIVWQADDDIWVAEVSYGVQATRVVRVTPATPNQRIGIKGRFPTLLTEVSVYGDLISWTYDGQIHAVRLAVP